jgi:hypothetical protein
VHFVGFNCKDSMEFGSNGCFNVSLYIVHSLKYVSYIRDISENFGFILDVIKWAVQYSFVLMTPENER